MEVVTRRLRYTRPLWKASALSVVAAIGLALCCSCARSFSQQLTENDPVVPSGDQPDDPGPLATDISPALRPEAIRAAMRRVADWQLQRVENQPASRSWEFGAMDVGFIAASRTLHDPRYSQYVASVGAGHRWELEQTEFPANDFAIAQAFLELYTDSHDESEIAPLRKRVDAELPLVKDWTRFPWYWSDALFMEPPVVAGLVRVTRDPKYLQYLDHEWLVSQTLLYDRNKHLFSRDITFLDQHEKNGEKIFWSRGNLSLIHI